MADNIAYIHSNKLAKYNYKYYGKDGSIYIGQKDGRLKKQIISTQADPVDVSLTWGNITGNILNQGDLVTYVTDLIAAITLDDLADVTITTPAAGDVLTYDAVNNIWVNLPGGGGVTTFSAGTTGLTPVAPTAGAVTLGGVLNVVNGGTGVSTVPANGRLLIGNGTGYTVAPLTAGTGISIATGAGSITITNSDRGSSQDIFKNIASPFQTTITADNNNDTLTIIGGTGIGIATNAGTDTITITNTQPGATYTGRIGDVNIDGNNEISTVATFSGFLLMGG